MGEVSQNEIMMRFHLPWLRGLLTIIFTCLLLGISSSSVWAAGTMTLAPTSGTGAQFSMDVVIDTGGDAVVEAQVVLDYDPAILEVTQATIRDLFTVKLTPAIDNVQGKLTLLTYMSDESDKFQGTDTLANVQFRGKSAGTANVTIRCTPQATNDSNLRKAGASIDILDCAQVVNASYAVSGPGSGVEVTGTPTPTPTTGAGPTPTVNLTTTPTPTTAPAIGSSGDSELTPTPTPPSELLTTASLTPTLTFAMIGAILLIGSLLMFIW